MEKKEENYIRQLLLELEDYLFSLKWYDKEDNEIMLKNIIGFDSIFQIIPKRFHKLLEGKIYTQEELSKAREEGKKEAFTKDEWFMLKLAMNDIFNNGNTAYEEISKKIEGYLKGELSGEAEHIKAHKEYLATSKQDTPKEWEEDIRREYGHMYIRNEDDEFCLVINEIDWLIDEIKQLLDKAREEGYKKGYIDGQTEKTNKPKPVMSEFDKTSYLN